MSDTLHSRISTTLQQHFGFDSLRYGQQEVIEKVLSGHSSAAIFPTGSGKSLCYQLPALMLPHLTLVISPLLALMKDQLDFLTSKGINASSIDSTQTRQETQAIMQSVKDGQTKVLMISVERLKNERFRQFISQVPISLLVVDEAHCISEWGHNFRPDYLKLPHYKQQLNIPQVLLLTATATTQVIEDMQAKFAIAPDDVVVTGFYRSNLDLEVIPCEDSNKLATLNALVQKQPTQPTIVYVTLQHSAEDVARALQAAGVNAAAYHAGLKADVREQLQQRFMAGAVDCIVATIAFGMGVDKSDIRRVIHFDLPKSVENYSQEIGRAGRDGQPSKCIIIANQTGRNTLENFVFGDTPDLSSIKLVLGQVIASSPQWETVLLRLSKETNIRQLPLKTLLVYLEISGIIEPKYSYFADYRFKFLLPAAQIVAKFEGERQHFVQGIFNCSPKARTWCQLDFEAIYQAGIGDRQRVITAMDYFHQQGWIELESKQLTDVYQVSNTQIDVESEAQKLFNLFKQKEINEVARIEQMISFFESNRCLSASLAEYFADAQAPQACGHCSVCRGAVASLPSQPTVDIETSQLQSWVTPFVQAATQPLTSEAITRFLCGIATPLSTHLKASKMAGYGKLENARFEDVLKLTQQIQ
ncbi:RecQ family ATP-dependent DNA helicase [Vibrio maerlii]|uniref:RecQ family ATP-dependent DNA helicase n=1 Tax=Vibrio maerlii TaxID=2231648 RepID=UPI000E3E4E41|nr:ATP-dependent DNA helicase RecQ [Vibrio maerlii]